MLICASKRQRNKIVENRNCVVLFWSLFCTFINFWAVHNVTHSILKITTFSSVLAGRSVPFIEFLKSVLIFYSHTGWGEWLEGDIVRYRAYTLESFCSSYFWRCVWFGSKLPLYFEQTPKLHDSLSSHLNTFNEHKSVLMFCNHIQWSEVSSAQSAHVSSITFFFLSSAQILALDTFQTSTLN